MELNEAIRLAQQGDALAQRYLYERYKMALFTVCLRYSRDRSEAEDMLQEGFINIFRNLSQYTGKGEVGHWMRKVMVNAALQYLRKWKREWNHVDSDQYNSALQTHDDILERLSLEELTKLIQQLPQGYRVVFNLFVIEGYSHKEIADLLGVSTNTTKTQLFKAKAALRKQLKQQYS